MDITTTGTCVQCHQWFKRGQLFDYTQTSSEASSRTVFVGICDSPECPNYGLLQMGEEFMNNRK